MLPGDTWWSHIREHTSKLIKVSEKWYMHIDLICPPHIAWCCLHFTRLTYFQCFFICFVLFGFFYYRSLLLYFFLSIFSFLVFLHLLFKCVCHFVGLALKSLTFTLGHRLQRMYEISTRFRVFFLIEKCDMILLYSLHIFIKLYCWFMH